MPPHASIPRGGGPRAALLTGLVILTVGQAGVLAFEAYRASRSHRLTAERLLRDYASFAAFELLANADKSLEGTLTAALGPVTRTAESPYDALLAPSVLAATADSTLRCADPAGDSVRSYFRLSMRDGRLTLDPALAPGGPRRAAIAGWVADTLLAHYRNEYRPASGYAVVLRRAGGLALVYRIKYAPHQAPLAAYGILTCASALEAPLFRQALARGPLLPASVTGGVPVDSLLSVEVRDAGEREFLSAGPRVDSRFEAEAFAARLGGVTVRAALVPGTVPLLAVAQAPSSRLPFLIGSLAVTLALATVALVQLKREHELARLRTDFVSRVSHELRTPLAQILLFGETLLLNRAGSDQARRQAAQTIVDEAKRLMGLVENILRFSRAPRAGDGPLLAPELATTPLAPLLESVITGFQPLAWRAGMTLRSTLDPDLQALADPQCTRQIVLNLLDNAVKYGPRGQTITVGAAGFDGSARVWVEDQGTGVPPGDREVVFQHFTRGSRPGNGAGTGLGLAVVKELAALQGGKVWVEAGAGGGARFVVELRAENGGPGCPIRNPS